jgi:hypothetical protein
MRRLLWLALGAGLGISGYRRAMRVIRAFGRPAAGTRPRLGLAGFARDVRDGMDLYAERQRLDHERRLDNERRLDAEGPKFLDMKDGR